MHKRLRSIQWNIGGGKIRELGSNPTQDSGYDQDGLEVIIDTLVSQNPDIVTLQETHEDGDISQTAQIAEALGHEFSFTHTYAPSHIEDGFKLGQGITSRYPFLDETFYFFLNPQYSGDWSGEQVVSHDKGISVATLDLGKRATLKAQTLHSVPFNAFGVVPGEGSSGLILDDMQTKILATAGEVTLLQGDFNLNSPTLRNFLPRLFQNGFREIIQEQATTPRGKKIDHILFAGMSVVKSCVHSDSLSDHYPIISEIEIIR